MHLGVILAVAGVCIALPTFALLTMGALELWELSDWLNKRCLAVFAVGALMMLIGLAIQL